MFLSRHIYLKLCRHWSLLIRKITGNSSIFIQRDVSASRLHLSTKVIYNYCVELSLNIDILFSGNQHIGRIPIEEKLQEIPSLTLPTILKL